MINWELDFEMPGIHDTCSWIIWTSANKVCYYCRSTIRIPVSVQYEVCPFLNSPTCKHVTAAKTLASFDNILCSNQKIFLKFTNNIKFRYLLVCFRMFGKVPGNRRNYWPITAKKYDPC